jgi:hypothetical protein
MRCIRDGCKILYDTGDVHRSTHCESTVLVFSHHVSHNDEKSKLCIMMFRPARKYFGFVYCLYFL